MKMKIIQLRTTLFCLLLTMMLLVCAYTRTLADEGNEYDKYTLLFGDPHVHTCLSDGDESPDFAMIYAREVSHLDWCVITDHAEWMDPSAHDYYRTIPALYDDPGRFCVIFGYEYTDFQFNNHRNLYTLDTTLPILSSSDPDYSDINKVFEAIAGRDAIVVPHHPMTQSRERWWARFDPDLEPLVEIYSKWGLSLYDGNPRPLHNSFKPNAVYDALSGQQLRLGFLGGSDTHLSRPGSNLLEVRTPLKYAKAGITGVWAEEFTNESIFKAMKARRTYALTGERVELKFLVNGYVMGSEITSSEPPVLTFMISSETRIATVKVNKITREDVITIGTFSPHSNRYDGSYTDPDFAESAGYFVIVELTNNDLAISSPVWVDFER